MLASRIKDTKGWSKDMLTYSGISTNEFTLLKSGDSDSGSFRSFLIDGKVGFLPEFIDMEWFV